MRLSAMESSTTISVSSYERWNKLARSQYCIWLGMHSYAKTNTWDCSGGSRRGRKKAPSSLNYFDRLQYVFFLYPVLRFVSEFFKIRLRWLNKASKALKLPGPLSGPWIRQLCALPHIIFCASP